MLALARSRGQSVSIDNGRIIVTVVEVKGVKVILGFEADKSIPIFRQEIQDEIRPGGAPAMKLEWRPIESAPKDGTVLLFWLPEYEHGVAFGYWSETFKEWLDDEDGCAIKEPTHWQPLPAPPGEES